MNLSKQVGFQLNHRGFEFFSNHLFQMDRNEERGFKSLRCGYDGMPEDPHLNPGEGERFRRYARFCIDPKTLKLSLFPHDRFYQSKTYDVLYGDVHREFPPLTPELATNPFFQNLLKLNFLTFNPVSEEPYEISVHMIRIAATLTNQRGRPAPEGIHRDGYHYAAIHLMERRNLTGAENRLYDLNKNIIFRTLLERPMDSILLDDRRVFHGVEPFTALQTDESSYRDILILLYQPLSDSPQAATAARRLT